ncbi:TRAP transporter small permease [Halomonas sp. G11]|jgi:TRAP-type C4-dicarboxylate transport system permease small subunit|uniref:TRAP transporter small permease n=1 Tax=Halomonas sp. G11 TaxID=1684425 RepID=UPI0008008DC0|nr:TRAP transporter small permease [Halomonas sp. G11]OAZ99102.1 C4-dicarboxylate ABC transporter permease [Halomonas sp. G11]
MTIDKWPAETSDFQMEEDDTFEWRDYGVEDYATLVVFWLLALDVFMQFFSRYVLGNSIAWTEEMARYLLVTVGFMGGSMAVRTGTHISVEFFYRYMPGWMSRLLMTLVDIVSIGFFAIGAWITWKLADRTTALMASVDIPKSFLYYLVLLGFLLMLGRAIQIAVLRWRNRSPSHPDAP